MNNLEWAREITGNAEGEGVGDVALVRENSDAQLSCRAMHRGLPPGERLWTRDSGGGSADTARLNKNHRSSVRWAVDIAEPKGTVLHGHPACRIAHVFAGSHTPGIEGQGSPAL